MKKILAEPLVHFILLGGLLFIIYGFLNRNEDNPEEDTIYIEDTDIERLVQAYRQNWNTLPDSITLHNLLQEEIKSEIFYREALRMQLDHNDEIIRRRLKQKYEFLIKDLSDMQQPTEEILRTFYKEHPNNYKSANKISFGQIYFSPDTRDNPKADAELLLPSIQDKTDVTQFKGFGDNFHLQAYYADRDFEAIWQLFGRDFAEAVFKLPQIGWATTPITSGYGQHLVYITDIKQSEVLPFDQIKANVEQDWKSNQLNQYNEQLFKNLQQEYKVVYDLDKWKKIME